MMVCRECWPLNVWSRSRGRRKRKRCSRGKVFCGRSRSRTRRCNRGEVLCGRSRNRNRTFSKGMDF